MPHADVRAFLSAAGANPDIAEALHIYHDTLKVDPLLDTARKYGYQFTLEEFLKVRDDERRAGLQISQLAAEGQATSPYLDDPSSPTYGQGIAPFRLYLMFVSAWVGGWPAAAMLASENWTRFGFPKRAKLTSGLAVFGTLLLGVLWGVAAEYPTIVIPVTLLPILPLGGLVLWQQSAFNTWAAAHNGRKPTLRESNIKSYRYAVGLGVVVNLVLGVGTAFLTQHLMERLGSGNVYDGQGIHVEYPHSFVRYQFPESECKESRCLVAAGTDDQAFVFFIFQIVVYDPERGRFGVAYNDEAFQAVLMDEYTRASLSSRKEIKVDGHHALRADFYHYGSLHEAWARYVQVIIEDGTDAVYVVDFIVQQVDDVDNDDATIEEIIASITFDD